MSTPMMCRRQHNRRVVDGLQRGVGLLGLLVCTASVARDQGSVLCAADAPSPGGSLWLEATRTPGEATQLLRTQVVPNEMIDLTTGDLRSNSTVYNKAIPHVGITARMLADGSAGLLNSTVSGFETAVESVCEEQRAPVDALESTREAEVPSRSGESETLSTSSFILVFLLLVAVAGMRRRQLFRDG